jgi:hypothetical protein
MNSVFSIRSMQTALIAALVAMSAASFAGSASSCESAHVSLGIVGRDAQSSSGVSRGVEVIEVFGPHAGRDLARGDVVVRVDGWRVRDGGELRDVLSAVGSDPVPVEVVRDGRHQNVQVSRIRLDEARLSDDDVLVIRRMARDIHRDVLRNVQRRSIRIRTDRRDLQARIQDVVRRVRDRLRDLEDRLEAPDWL